MTVTTESGGRQNAFPNETTPYIDKKIWVENLGEFLRKLSVKT